MYLSPIRVAMHETAAGGRSGCGCFKSHSISAYGEPSGISVPDTWTCQIAKGQAQCFDYVCLYSIVFAHIIMPPM